MIVRSIILAPVLLCGAYVLLGARPTKVLADEPAPNAHAIGIAESMLKYCARVDADVALKLRDKVRTLEQRASRDELARLRSSDEYRKAFDSVTYFTGKVDEHNAKRLCSESLAANN
jgi:hypothetical protein